MPSNKIFLSPPSRKVHMSLYSLHLALEDAEDAGLMSEESTADIFSNTLHTAGVNYDWWFDQGLPCAEIESAAE